MSTNCNECKKKLTTNVMKKHYLIENSECNKYNYICELSINNVFRSFIGINNGITLNTFDEFIRENIIKEEVFDNQYRHVSEFNFKNNKKIINFTKGEKNKWINTENENIIESLNWENIDDSPIYNNFSMKMKIDKLYLVEGNKFTYTYDLTKDITINIVIHKSNNLIQGNPNIKLLCNLEKLDITNYIENHEDNNLMALYKSDHNFAKIVNDLSQLL